MEVYGSIVINAEYALAGGITRSSGRLAVLRVITTVISLFIAIDNVYKWARKNHVNDRQFCDKKIKTESTESTSHENHFITRPQIDRNEVSDATNQNLSSCQSIPQTVSTESTSHENHFITRPQIDRNEVSDATNQNQAACQSLLQTESIESTSPENHLITQPQISRNEVSDATNQNQAACQSLLQTVSNENTSPENHTITQPQIDNYEVSDACQSLPQTASTESISSENQTKSTESTSPAIDSHEVFDVCILCQRGNGDFESLTCGCNNKAHNKCLRSQKSLIDCPTCKRKVVPEKNLGEDCSLCLSNIYQNKLTTSCGHNFHKPCLDEWLNNARTCPFCKEPILS